MTAFDVLLAGGTVIDPGAGVSEVRDVGIVGGLIARIADHIPREDAVEVVDVTGRVVTAGLIDLHAHVMRGFVANGLDPDVAGVEAGVTTVVDGGSAGSDTFEDFLSLLPGSRTRVIPFLNIARAGLASLPEITSESDIDVAGTRRILAQHAGQVAGIKVRMVSPAIEVLGIGLLRMSRDVAREAGIPLMVHVGDSLGRPDRAFAGETLSLLGEGDIVTHAFTPHPGGVLDGSGLVLQEAREAAARGVLFDGAPGRNSFSFDVARRVLDQGIPLYTISTDLTVVGRADTVFSLTEVMSRFLELGFSLAEVIRMCTSQPARAVGMADSIGNIDVGRSADLTVLDVRSGAWTAHDSVGAMLALSTALVPVLTIRAGSVIPAGPGPHPWGWEPPRAGQSSPPGGI